MTKMKDAAVALIKFEEAAIKHAEATEHGDYKTANKSYAIIAKVIAFLKVQNEVEKTVRVFRSFISRSEGLGNYLSFANKRTRGNPKTGRNCKRKWDTLSCSKDHSK